MKRFAEKLKFSDKRENKRAVKIDRRRNVNYYETLCLYCANNNIDTNNIKDHDFYTASITLEQYGKLPRSKNGDIFYFWFL